MMMSLHSANGFEFDKVFFEWIGIKPLSLHSLHEDSQSPTKGSESRPTALFKFTPHKIIKIF